MAFSISHNLDFEPRVTHCLGFSGVKLGDAIELYLDQHRPMELTIVGPSATLATHWARQHFEDNPRVKWYEDEPFGNPTTLGIDADQLFDPVHYQLTLAPLDRDDIIRIMLEFQPQACAGVIGRLQSDQFTEIGSDLRIWLRLLEELVDHPNESALNLLWTIFQAELAENKCTSTEAIRKLLDTFASSRGGAINLGSFVARDR